MSINSLTDSVARLKRVNQLTKAVIGLTALLSIGLILVVALGYEEIAFALLLATQPLVILALWMQNRSLASLNDAFKKRVEMSTSTILNDIARSREEILQAIEDD